jgi:hypothetical protein
VISIPRKIEKLFDAHSKIITQEILIKKNVSQETLSFPMILISTEVQNSSHSFTIGLPTTINKFLYSQKVSIENFSFGEKNKNLLVRQEFLFDELVLSAPENLSKIMDEVAVISEWGARD